MKKLVYIVLFSFLCYHSYSQKDTIQARVVLIGDAGDFHGGKHPVVSAVKNNIKFDSKTTVVFLGDNLYYTGLPDESYRDYDKRRAVLDTQVNIAKGTPAKVYFMPGNHDWNRASKGGYEAIVRQQRYIDSLGDKNVKYYPEDGCPGPVEINLTPDVVLLIMDSQWWIHPYDKPGIESDCPYKTKDEVLNQIDDILSRNAKKLVLFACHHPFKSYGIHGGYFTLKQHIFPFTEMKPNLYIPLPIIGSIYPIARGVFGTPQDLKHPAYQNMISDVQKVTKKYPNVIFVSGHEHNLQMIKDSSYNYIISGSGTKKTRVSKNKKLLYGAQENGFVTLEISTNKNVKVNFYTVNGDSSKNAYTKDLMNFSKLSKVLTDSLVETSQAIPFKDSVEVAINKKYEQASGMQRIFLGNNYRKEWATPVHLKVFNISKEHGGFKIESLGGGKETKALRLVDSKGKEWTLRSINKNPEGALPEEFRGSVASGIVQDLISASHPYGQLSVPELAKAAKVIVPSPTIYFVPDDPAFGFYRPLFANTVCALEEREPTPHGEDTKSTAKVINRLYEDNDNRIDQPAVLRARLLDMLIGDWDRHFNQWRFGEADTGKGKLYYPIPRDRDQVFFKGDGIVINAASMDLLPYLKGFRKTFPKINWFNWSTRDFDRLFLNRLSQQDWINITEDFKRNMTDEVIANAVKKMPPAIYALNGQNIIDKLKSRRELLTKAALKYYNFLSKEVTIAGSNQKELFKVTASGNDLLLKVFKRKNGNDSVSLMYSRVFDNKHTKEIRLFGLNDNDKFDIDEQVKSKINIKMIGGRGLDTFNIKGDVHNSIYDITTEKNFISGDKHTHNRTSASPEVNKYEATGFKYNIFRFPRLNLGYNVEDKLLVGVGFLSRTYQFRKEPYANQQRLSTLYALNRKSYQLKYAGEFNQVIGNTDVLVNAETANPVLNNFFGLGNETVIDSKHDLEYYRVRYKYIEGSVLLRQRLFRVLSLSAGPTWYHYWNKYSDNMSRILSTPSVVHLDSANVYATKSYLGGKFNILLNTVNSDILPTRGIYWLTDFTALAGMQSTSKPLTRLTSDLTLYSSFADPANLVSVLRLGGGRIFSKDYEYFQALNLGQNNFLRGFRKNRFSGQGLAYGSIELRVKLFDSKSYILPGGVGLIGYDEVGRVWVKNEDSDRWHNSFGGGFYFAAYNTALLSATAGFSSEERIFNFSIGTKFNITF